MKKSVLNKAKIDVISNIEIIKNKINGFYTNRLFIDKKEIILNGIDGVDYLEKMLNDKLSLQFYGATTLKNGTRKIRYYLIKRDDIILFRLKNETLKELNKRSKEKEKELIFNKEELNRDNNILNYNQAKIKEMNKNSKAIIELNYNDLSSKFKEVIQDIKEIKENLNEKFKDKITINKDFKINKKVIRDRLTEKYKLDEKLNSKLVILYCNLLDYKLQNKFNFDFKITNATGFTKVMNIIKSAESLKISVDYKELNNIVDLESLNTWYNTLNKIIFEAKQNKKGYYKKEDTQENKKTA